jgi:hypothetical protein
MQVFIYYKITLHVSGVYRTHHQKYIKLQLQLLVQVISRVRATTFRQRGLIRPDMACTRSCSCSLMYS